MRKIAPALSRRVNVWVAALVALPLAVAFAAAGPTSTAGAAQAVEAPQPVLDWVRAHKVAETLPVPPGEQGPGGFVMPPYLAPGSDIPIYPPQGALWRRNGVLAIYKLTQPLQGSEPGPLRWAVKVWQQSLAEAGYEVPRHGLYDQATAEAVRRWQADQGFAVTGELTMAHARALLAPTISRQAQAAGMPAPILCGHLTAESVLDPAAVGANGVDLGIAQISVPYNPGLSEKEFFDKDDAIRYMAQRDARAMRRYNDWKIAVVAYNSPLRARQWAKTGQPSPLAQRYADRVMLGCGPLDEQISVTSERSLERVAVHYLGDPERKYRLAQINNLPVDAVLTEGQKIKLPKP